MNKNISDINDTTIACMYNKADGAPALFSSLNNFGRLLSLAAKNSPLVGAIIQLLTVPAAPIAKESDI